MNKTENVLELAIMLKSNPMQIKDIMQKFDCSRGTAHNYIRTIRKVFEIQQVGRKYSIEKLEIKQ